MQAPKKPSVHPSWSSVAPQITELLSLESVSFPNPKIHWKAKLPAPLCPWCASEPVTFLKEFITAWQILIKSSRKQVLSTFLQRRKTEILKDLKFHSSFEQLGSEMGLGFVSSAEWMFWDFIQNHELGRNCCNLQCAEIIIMDCPIPIFRCLKHTRGVSQST